jgi:hypothetical protein
MIIESISVRINQKIKNPATFRNRLIIIAPPLGLEPTPKAFGAD